MYNKTVIDETFRILLLLPLQPNYCVGCLLRDCVANSVDCAILNDRIGMTKHNQRGIEDDRVQKQKIYLRKTNNNMPLLVFVY